MGLIDFYVPLSRFLGPVNFGNANRAVWIPGRKFIRLQATCFLQIARCSSRFFYCQNPGQAGLGPVDKKTRLQNFPISTYLIVFIEHLFLN